MRAKIFVVNGLPRIRPRDISPRATSIPGMSIGAWGDPHMTIRVLGLNPSNPLISTNVAKWGDNQKGLSGETELLLVDLETTTDTFKFFYTNKTWGGINGAKVVRSFRIVYNGVSTSYTDVPTSTFTRGPVTIRVVRYSTDLATTGISYRYDFEISWQRINNVTKFNGAIVPILKRVANNNGRPWNGGDGINWDGFGKALAAYGLTRSSFETGFGIQSLPEELEFLADESNFLETMIENSFVQPNNMLDNLENLGENGEGDGAPVADWDNTYPESVAVLSFAGGVEGYVAASGAPNGGGITGFVVSGAGTTAVNGTYCPCQGGGGGGSLCGFTGMSDGKPIYVFADGNSRLLFSAEFMGFPEPYWYIERLNDNIQYSVLSSTGPAGDTPPQIGWTAFFGSNPPPSVSSTVCN